MKHFVVLFSLLAVVSQSTQSLSVYEQWLLDTEAAAAATAQPTAAPKPIPVQPKQSRQQFIFPTKKQNPGIRPLRPVVVPITVAAKPVGRKSQESELEKKLTQNDITIPRLIFQSAQNTRSLALRRTRSLDLPWTLPKKKKSVYSTSTSRNATFRPDSSWAA